MEFKAIFLHILLQHCGRINRIRLEFKVHIRIIRVCNPVSVLIESDWNLKPEAKWRKNKGHSVLIESDWNLKALYIKDAIVKGASINRIRLEFKVRKHILLRFLPLCINRIRLEFKGDAGNQLRTSKGSINRIRLEFKAS